MFNINEIKGVIPALITVFDKNGEIDVAGTKETINFLIEQGVNGVYVAGSTGEGFTMDKEERKRYIKLVVDTVDKRIPVITHVGMIGTKNSIELAQYSEQVGADAISSVPPFYWKFSEEQVFNYYKEISEATMLPMIVYNVPMAGLMAVDFITRLGTIENVKGVKFTALSHHDIVLIKDALGEDFIVYSGADEMSLSGLMNGADGIIGSFFNMIPELFIHIYNNVNEGNYQLALGYQKTAIRIITLALKYDYYAIIKLGLKWMGINGGYTRRPFTKYSKEEEQAIKEKFIQLQKEFQIEGVRFLDSI